MVADAGLFEKQPGYYVRKCAEIVGLFAITALILVYSDALIWRLFAALLLAITFTQVAYIGHDAGHHHIFPKRPHNDWFGVAIVNLLIGLSYGWWVEKHNQHHEHTNDVDHDPDIRFPLMAFDEQQLSVPRTAFQNFFIRRQAWLFFPLLTLLPISMRLDSFMHVARTGARNRIIEAALLVAHIGLLAWMAIGLLGVAHGLIFLAVNQAAFGVLLGSVFAVNHKGMPMTHELEKLSPLWRHAATARNLRGHPVTGYWFGGLDCQVEHHLFPMLPRHNLRKAAPMVKKFCEERGVPYCESGVIASYAEVLQHLHTVSAPLRAPAPKQPLPTRAARGA
jgi:fatty acid desaturase